MYVDEIVFGADNDDSAFALCIKSEDILRSGSLNLWKFVTNSPALQDRINKADGLLPQNQCTVLLKRLTQSLSLGMLSR